MMKPLSRTTLRQAVRDVILDRAISGQLSPGERINESMLAQELGVSPTPVREALISLEGSGFFSAKPGKGFVIAPYDAQEVRDIASVLSTLETTALLLTTPFDSSGIARLCNLNDAFRSTHDDIDLAIKADVQWHTELVASCSNRYLLRLIRSARQSLHRYDHVFLAGRLNTADSADQHAKVIDSLKENDMERAIQSLILNWKISAGLLAKCVEEKTG